MRDAGMRGCGVRWVGFMEASEVRVRRAGRPPTPWPVSLDIYLWRYILRLHLGPYSVVICDNDIETILKLFVNTSSFAFHRYRKFSILVYTKGILGATKRTVNSRTVLSWFKIASLAVGL